MARAAVEKRRAQGIRELFYPDWDLFPRYVRPGAVKIGEKLSACPGAEKVKNVDSVLAAYAFQDKLLDTRNDRIAIHQPNSVHAWMGAVAAGRGASPRC